MGRDRETEACVMGPSHVDHEQLATPHQRERYQLRRYKNMLLRHREGGVNAGSRCAHVRQELVRRRQGYSLSANLERCEATSALPRKGTPSLKGSKQTEMQTISERKSSGAFLEGSWSKTAA